LRQRNIAYLEEEEKIMFDLFRTLSNSATTEFLILVFFSLSSFLLPSTVLSSSLLYRVFYIIYFLCIILEFSLYDLSIRKVTYMFNKLMCKNIKIN